MAFSSTDLKTPIYGIPKIQDTLFLHLVFLLGYLLIQNTGVPSHNELVYLLHLAKQWNPNFLANDWTFSGPLPSHFVFNVLFGALTLLFSLEVVGWIGRIFSWTVILLALFQLGKHFRIPLWMITLSVLFWLFYRQSIVGGEWILGPFEAKGISYALLLFSLNGFMHQRVIWPSILLGLAFSFHPIVGLWGALAVGLSLVVLRYSTRTIIEFSCYTTLFALPGLIPLLTMPLETSTEAWRFVAFVVMPYHFDPFSFSPWKLLLLPVMLGFNWLHVMWERQNRSLQFLITIQVFLAAFFVLGFVARIADADWFLKLMPGRLFPVLLPLFFFFHVMNTLQHCSMKSGKAVVAGAVLVVTALGIPGKLYLNSLKVLSLEDAREEEDLTNTFKWIAQNTPDDSIIILPPWRKDSFYFSRRAQIASWWVLRLDRLTEWRERVETLAGDVSRLTDRTERTNKSLSVQHYTNLTQTDIEALAETYGADFLVSSARYEYRVLFRSGVYKIYSLTTHVSTGRSPNMHSYPSNGL